MISPWIFRTIISWTIIFFFISKGNMFNINFSESITNLLNTNKLYRKWIYEIQEHVLHLTDRNTHIRHYQNVTKNQLGETLQDISKKEYLQLHNQKFLVYEIFGLIKMRQRFNPSSSKIQLVNVLFSYPDSKFSLFTKQKIIISHILWRSRDIVTDIFCGSRKL